MSRTPERDHPEVEDPERDLVLLVQACGARLNDDVLARVRSEAGDDVRIRDGYVFQHIVDGPCSVSELARRLGVTQQATSKQVADLVGRGLVVRRRDPADARAWQVSLSERGRDVVHAGRRARRAVTDDLVAALGSDVVTRLVDDLTRLSDHSGAMETLLGRELRLD